VASNSILEIEFFNETFYKIIDQDKYLIGFENGIYDLYLWNSETAHVSTVHLHSQVQIAIIAFTSADYIHKCSACCRAGLRDVWCSFAMLPRVLLVYTLRSLTGDG
jgi:hypothetical protein